MGPNVHYRNNRFKPDVKVFMQLSFETDKNMQLRLVLDADECPEVRDGTETLCNECAWHDKFDKLI